MKIRTRLLNYLVILGLTAAATPLYSTTATYDTRSSWVAAVSGVTTTTFDTALSGYTPPGPDGFVNLANGGITLDGVTFQGYSDTSEQYGLTIFAAGPNSPYWNWGTGGAILTGGVYQGALAHLHIGLETSVTAWGTDLMLGNGITGTYSIEIDGNPCPTACLAPTFALPQAAFFGMTSDTPFSFIDIFVPSNGRAEIDNFSTATALAGVGGGTGGGGGGEQIPSGDTPEIGTILLCATGLISLAKFRKMRLLSFS